MFEPEEDDSIFMQKTYERVPRYQKGFSYGSPMETSQRTLYDSVYHLYFLEYVCGMKKRTIMPSVVDSPLSNEFLISLTSTCDPGTRNMPCCCKPERNTTQNLGIQSCATATIISKPQCQLHESPLETHNTEQEM